jgi:hypothetical protein
MAVLKAKKRNSLKGSQFGLPGERKYPVNDPSHARNAKARASEMEHKGRLSASQKAEIDAKADRVLGHGSKPDPKEKHTMRKETPKRGHKEPPKKTEHHKGHEGHPKGPEHHREMANKHKRLETHHSGMRSYHEKMASASDSPKGTKGEDPSAGKPKDTDKFSEGKSFRKAPLKHGAQPASPDAGWQKRGPGTASREGY